MGEEMDSWMLGEVAAPAPWTHITGVLSYLNYIVLSSQQGCCL